jgi:hypothetical protein
VEAEYNKHAVSSIHPPVSSSAKRSESLHPHAYAPAPRCRRRHRCRASIVVRSTSVPRPYRGDRGRDARTQNVPALSALRRELNGAIATERTMARYGGACLARIGGRRGGEVVKPGSSNFILLLFELSLSAWLYTDARPSICRRCVTKENVPSLNSSGVAVCLPPYSFPLPMNPNPNYEISNACWYLWYHAAVNA